MEKKSYNLTIKNILFIREKHKFSRKIATLATKMSLFQKFRPGLPSVSFFRIFDH